jgi:predicted membrane-bound dolichyl-phosphate-mannose-protein mannosyltransferase
VELLFEYLVDMEIARRIILRLDKWEYTWICLLTLVLLALHFSFIYQPNTPLFDEQHYVPEARAIIQEHKTLHPEHPPLGKLFIASGIVIFGDNPVGWRFFAVICGTASIFLFYLICRQLTIPRAASLLATFLLATENLTFIQSSVAMLDVFSVTFVILAFWLYLKRYYPLAAVAIALAALAKLTGVLALPVIVLHWLIIRRDQPVHFIASMLLAPLSFLLIMPALDFIALRKLLDPISQLKMMLSQSATLKFSTVTHPSLSRPWEWVLLPKIMPYWYQPHYIALVSFTIWALIIPTVGYMTFKTVKGNSAGTFGLSWFAGTYLPWIPLNLITDRVTFIFYFYPVIGSLCIGLGMGLYQLLGLAQARQKGKLKWGIIIGIAVYLVLHLAIFVVLMPLSTWWNGAIFAK